MNVREIIDPLEQNHPCGENVRSNTAFREIYYRIKDARNAARTAERSIIPGETITIAPAWHDVSNLGLQLLSSKSKDIEVLAWLAEAQLRLRGFSGLHDVYVATVSLLDKHFDALHSIGDGDVEERFAPFAGLNGVGGEGTLIQAIRLTSLIPGGKFAQFSLWDFQLSQRPNETERRKELQQAAAEAGVAQMSAYLDVLTGCIAAFDRMVEILDEHCGDQAPPSSNTRNVLQEAASAIRMLAGIEAPTEAPLAAPQALASQGSEPLPASETDGSEAIGLRPVSAEMIRSREEAFELLIAVARYFRRTEPHSPISMSIETLVRRGRMDFFELLAELLPEQQTRNAVLTAAGIQPVADKGG
ncbi:type VI secretion system protein TssA (plasmid) [Rhizobium leguminosarum]|uniref:ImpA n=1 Tax=Rhizobium leguminosarum bv. trifolii TaxID=386 RepID=Q93ED3_RHILT|nr:MULTISPECIES: type VI secretion system protein TssA [Rhizobium]AAL17808.1 ImpA [Rhizobium leguminosarum bv. trifolii]TBF27829.1 type VI secretion system protein TssA [Rhizobium leguminosarum]TBF46779.1 type VI secretion system protein TssA [Rhizobium leguminosarum]TBF48588.1 type VI secretion system protein TssA [Rhizobium leguminosarum]TBF49824.1 type VI secretion system protein TssA [Rhizobium leguminosarum]